MLLCNSTNKSELELLVLYIDMVIHGFPFLLKMKIYYDRWPVWNIGTCTVVRSVSTMTSLPNREASQDANEVL